MIRRSATAILFACVPLKLAHAEPAKIGAIIEYTGKCVKIDDEKETACAGIMRNMRFLDGYDSFQFNDTSKIFNVGVTTGFVGSQWKTNKAGGDAARLADTMVFMPLDEVVVADMNAKKMQSNKFRGQCVLEFRTTDTRRSDNIKKVWCEYSDGKSGHAFSLTDIERPVEIMMRDFRKYE